LYVAERIEFLRRGASTNQRSDTAASKLPGGSVRACDPDDDVVDWSR